MWLGLDTNTTWLWSGKDCDLDLNTQVYGHNPTWRCSDVSVKTTAFHDTIAVGKTATGDENTPMFGGDIGARNTAMTH